MKRNIILWLLVCAMLSPTLASCGEKTLSETTGTETTAEDTTATAETETEETRAMHKVPESDFGGAGFHTLYPDWQGYKFYFFADEATGDAMNDAIYARKIQVEEYTNTKITEENGGGIDNMEGKVKKTVQAGEDTYQQVLLHCISGVAEMMTGGYLYNYDDLHYVDYTADWWNRPMMDALRLGKNTYYGVSDYMIPCPYAVFFNKDMVLENGFDDPYQLVYEGKWTLDRFVEMASAASRDLDGDGKHTKEDVFGMTANEGSKYICLMTGADQFVTGRDETGRRLGPSAQHLTERSVYP